MGPTAGEPCEAPVSCRGGPNQPQQPTVTPHDPPTIGPTHSPPRTPNAVHYYSNKYGVLMAKYRKYSSGGGGGEAGLDKPSLGAKTMCSK